MTDEHPPAGEPEPDDADPNDADPGDDEKIKSPFETGTINYMQFDRERLAVALEGPPVRGQRVDLGVGGPFLYRLFEVLHALAGHVQSREIGERGPLPQLSGVGAIALAGLTPGSAVFHFTVGDVDEQLLLAAGEPKSAMDEAVDLLIALIERSAGAETEEALLEHARTLPERAGTNYIDMLDVLIENQVTTRWQSSSRKVSLPASDAAHAKDVLDRVETLSVEEVTESGLLYEANSKSHEFRLESEGGRAIRGTYDEDLTEVIRGAWNHSVVVKLRVTHTRLSRSGRDRPDDVRLIEITEVLE